MKIISRIYCLENDILDQEKLNINNFMLGEEFKKRLIREEINPEDVYEL